MNLKYIVYCRKSSEQKDRQALSIEAQKRELLEFAQREKLQIVDLLEESQSAYKLGRPVFDKLMKLIESGSANAILTWKPDRLARNAMDGGRVIQALDDNHLQEIRTPYEIFRQTDNRMMVYIHFGMSNDYSRQISANVKRGNRQKYARGEFVGKAPVGYLNAKVGISSNIVLDPSKALLVKRLFTEYSKGEETVVDLLSSANSWGLNGINGKPLFKSGLYKILRNPVYYGLFKHGGEYHQGSYEPLINKKLFDRVQEALKEKGKPRKSGWIRHAYKGGLIKCGKCGCAITATTKIKYYESTGKTGIYTYYHCTKRKGNCHQQPISEEEMEQMIKQYLYKIEIDKEVWDLGISLLKAKYSDQIGQSIQSRKLIDSEQEKIDKDIEKLLHLRMDEEITAEEFLLAKKNLIDKKLELKEKLEDNEHTSSNWLELSEKFFENALQVRNIMESEDSKKKRELVQTVGWNLILDDKKLQFSFRKPYDVLLKPVTVSNVQGRRELNPH